MKEAARAVEDEPAPAAKRPAAEPKAKPFMPSFEDVARIVEASKQHSRSLVRTHENNPFKIYEHPKPAMPPVSMRMAADQALVANVEACATDWLAGGTFGLGQFAGEGLLFLGYAYLAELAQRPEYRVISETIADDATRKWIDLEVTGGEKAKKAREAGEEPDADDRKADAKSTGKLDKVNAIKDELVRLDAQHAMYCACRDDGFFGRTHIYMNFGEDFDNGDPKELVMPIGNGRDARSIGKMAGAKFERLKVIEPVWTYPQAYNATNPLALNWYDPQQWYVMGKEIHRSRLLTLVGHPVPDMLKPSYSFGGLSLSQMAQPYVDIWLQTRASVAALIHAFSVMVLKTDMQTLLAPGNANSLLARLILFNTTRDNMSVFALNKTEEFDNVAVPLGGLDQLQAQSQEHMSAVSRIPLVKLTGISPHGLNASSEGEIMVYDDTIGAYQNRFIRPPLTTIVNLIQLCRWREIDPEITLEFQKLRVMTEKEAADLQKAKAERDQIFVDGGAISNAEWRKAIIADPDLPYADLNPDDVPDLAAEEEEGLEPEGGRPDPKASGEPDKEPGGASDAVIPFAVDAIFGDAWSEGDHPRGQPGNAGQFGSGGGGGSSGKQTLKMPQYGLTPKPSAPHQHEQETGGEYFQKNWHKSGSVGGHNQPTAKQVAAYTAAYENQGKETAPAKPAPAEPLNPKNLKRVGEKMGSNPGGVFKDPSGREFYVKQGQSKEHVANELAAADLYHLAGAPTLNYRPVMGGGHIATEMSKLEKSHATQFSPEEKAKAQEDFVTHAWLANWDAVGTGSDNMGTVKGVPTALDLGGALTFRAQGAPKGGAFGDKVGELKTMRDPKMSPDSAKVFGSMTPEAMKASAAKVTAVSDADVRDAIAKNGLPPALATRLIARKRDIAKQFGLATDELAADEKSWEESKHPRSPDGKFGSGGGSGEGEKEGGEPAKEPAAGEPEKVKKTAFGGLWKAPKPGESESVNFNNNVASVIAKAPNAGQSYRQMLAFMIKEVDKHGAGEMYLAPLKAHLLQAWQKAFDKSVVLGNEADAKKIAAKLKELGHSAPAEAMAAPAPVVAPTPPPVPPTPKAAAAIAAAPPEPEKQLTTYGKKIQEQEAAKAAKAAEKAKASAFPAPTSAELEKAKKTAALQPQYLGIPDVPQTPAVAAAIKEFNDKYSGKEMTSQPALIQKVNDFKALQSKVTGMLSAEKQKAITAQKEQAAAAAAKLAAEMNDPEVKEHYDALKNIAGNVQQAWKEAATYIKHHKIEGVTPQEASYIMAYRGSHYGPVNKQLRSGVVTVEQWKYAAALDKALAKMPVYTGTVHRGADLTPEQFNKYKNAVGKVIPEPGFQSAGVKSKLWGHYSFVIESKTAADIRKFNPSEGGGEVVFKNNTAFAIKKVQGNTIHMEEI